MKDEFRETLPEASAPMGPEKGGLTDKGQDILKRDETSLVVQWLRLHAPNAEGWSLIPGQGTKSHRPQLRVPMLWLKVPRAPTKNEDPKWCNQDLAQPNK